MKSVFWSAGVSVLFVAGCTSQPFSYAQDRCQGGFNQCRTQCTSIGEGPARSACEQRCLTSETQCYQTGDGVFPSSLAQDALIAEKRSEVEKQADFERWKRERAAAEAAEAE
ncbi:MAG: hypothetical protein AAGC77_03205 [Pseudomonadota bacterium]